MAPLFFRKRIESKPEHGGLQAPPPDHYMPHEPYFGQAPPDERAANSSRAVAHPSFRENGEQVLINFLKKRLGLHADGFLLRLVNKTPVMDGGSYSYQLNQSTEESDLQIIHRDLIAGRLYRTGNKYIAAAWANLLLGDKFTPTGSRKQVHELTYVRTTCTCLVCLIRTGRADDNGDAQSEEDRCSVPSATSSYTPASSAMANFVRPYSLPLPNELKRIGGHTSWRELEIGTIVRLNSRAGAKLKFTDDMRALFGHICYTGPMTHETVYRKVTTIGVNYYLYNKGKKERKVYLQGDLVQLPLEMGVVKLGTRPLRMDEVGAYFLMYRRQVVKIYIGELVLEGNSFGSFISTGIRFYVGVGEEGGCAPVYPDYRMGPPRRLGVNELLLHHHMVDDLRVRVH